MLFLRIYGAGPNSQWELQISVHKVSFTFLLVVFILFTVIFTSSQKRLLQIFLVWLGEVYSESRWLGFFLEWFYVGSDAPRAKSTQSDSCSLLHPMPQHSSLNSSGLLRVTRNRALTGLLFQPCVDVKHTPGLSQSPYFIWLGAPTGLGGLLSGTAFHLHQQKQCVKFLMEEQLSLILPPVNNLFGFSVCLAVFLLVEIKASIATHQTGERSDSVYW